MTVGTRPQEAKSTLKEHEGARDGQNRVGSATRLLHAGGRFSARWSGLEAVEGGGVGLCE